MSPKKPVWKMNNDLQTVTVTFPTEPPAVLNLTVEGLEDLLEHLGEFRALMNPPVPAEHALGQRVAAIPDPLWQTEPEAMHGHSILHIRDPRFGWLHYVLARESAGKLAGLLRNQSDSPHPGQALGKTH